MATKHRVFVEIDEDALELWLETLRMDVQSPAFNADLRTALRTSLELYEVVTACVDHCPACGEKVEHGL